MHRSQVRPLFGDTDPMNVVYYGNYLRFFELGRAELMRSTGRPYSELADEGLHLPVTEAGLRYHRPALYDQLLTVEASVAWIKRASLRFNYRILGPGELALPLLVTGFTVHGCVDGSGRIKPLPAWVAPLLKQHLEN
ncbi:MAG: acyl-CoA thioesterase [Proteobacteria bacterium]|nr:acyl-CoA thioesterase [Pseudomonadota bacterium]MBU4275751.1 acyl-CoA thioesterase [Pseudomonadota bacterium]MBU4383786.1 acyl-CoA thioesterase [Pseudomonadota bacterium]MBU4605255.1 acyl-CoA thioesterase [Pseudomonadota bacterium]MCG2763428.1 acyl-CoA thioesterase [Desulfarculaceae bacterium]